MSKQVLSIEQMQHLKELGVDTSKASMYWVRLVRLPNVKNKEKEVLVDWFLDLQKEHMRVGYDEHECLPTFTLQDILDLLPKEIENYCLYIEWECVFISYQYDEGYEGMKCFHAIQIKENLIDAAYEMLCWVIDNGYLKVK